MRTHAHKFQVKRIIGQRDARLKKNQDKAVVEAQKKSKGDGVVREMYGILRELMGF